MSPLGCLFELTKTIGILVVFNSYLSATSKCMLEALYRNVALFLEFQDRTLIKDLHISVKKVRKYEF